MRTPIVAGNWKMNTTVAEAMDLTRAMREDLDATTGVEKVLCPPFVSLASVRDVIAGTSIKLGAQNMFYEQKGAYTGEISPLMLAPLCEHVILGHSERRQYFGETDEIVNKKVKSALAAGLKPIMCVGERLEENQRGETAQVVSRQVRGGLAGVEEIDRVVIAYEPIWAIGTGLAATGEQANDTIHIIRTVVAELFGAAASERLRIQYGGSVTAANSTELASQPDIDGALVGGASLKAADFVSIARQFAEVKGRR
ncbi:MAG: triose-phosphate isomerase [Chloroflexota bacterium]|nr:MAG: triose-phosphate isomerase [Chloroflexota bacterium]